MDGILMAEVKKVGIQAWISGERLKLTPDFENVADTG